MNSPAQSLSTAKSKPALPQADMPVSLPNGDDLAMAALTGADEVMLPAATDESHATDSEPVESADDEELAKSNQLADTLNSLQGLIERHARKLEELEKEVREKRESLRSFFENDAQLGEAEAKAEVMATEMKARKSQLQSEPQVTSLKVQLAELAEQKKEIEETLSNHLVNYHQITNSTSFDTSEGDQWDFSIRAKIKARKH
ncbi:MAG: hypothetical protein UW75_C0042G0008 [Parcubacteria group bacterium GW2011_GWF2_44_8]|nr:MAG: hypothetical protein UW75_C0042G0008 [Parcubacteria group bacterium GW2011_GWF2_44_8]